MYKILKLIILGLLINSNLIADDSLYNFEWLDQDKEIYVLQNRKYRKDGNFSISLLANKNLSSKFIDSYGGSFRVGYYFIEDWGIELGFSKQSGSENGVADGIIEQGAVPFYRKMDQVITASLIWSPFYGKFNTFNLVYYLDWYIGFGISKIKDLNNKNRFVVSSDTGLTEESHTGATWQTGFMFYLSQMISIRLEFMGNHYKADKERKTSTTGVFRSEEWFHFYDLNLGLQFLF